MSSLSLSTVSSPSLLPSSKTLNPNRLPSTPLSTFTTSPSSSSSSSLCARSRPNVSNTNFHLPSYTQDFGLGFGFPLSSSSPFASGPQTHSSAMRGAETDVMGLLFRERIVLLGWELDDFVADAIMSQLLLLDAKDPNKDIRLFINCAGGSLSSAMAVYDAIQFVRADVATIALGHAVSTSALILGGGTKGKRMAMPNSRIMIHQPLGSTSGSVIDVEIQAKELMENKRNVTQLICGFTGRTPEQVWDDIDRDRYMSPVEALEYGIIDHVIDRDAIIATEPIPERGGSTRGEEYAEDPEKFINPEVPDDEIY